MQDAHYSIMELAERLGALGAGPAAVGAAAAASRGMFYFILDSLTHLFLALMSWWE